LGRRKVQQKVDEWICISAWSRYDRMVHKKADN
ncbi:hypothetical protein T09_11899, partial [Trichinella sp. T9]